MCNHTFSISLGIGIHILHSKYISGQFLRNNSIIIPKSTACSGCTLNFFCLSEAPTGIAYVTFPDGSSRNTSDNYLNMIVEMQPGTTDFQVYNYKTYKPLLYGVYTCEVFDIFGPMLHYSVVIHSILPGRLLHVLLYTVNLVIYAVILFIRIMRVVVRVHK